MNADVWAAVARCAALGAILLLVGGRVFAQLVLAPGTPNDDQMREMGERAARIERWVLAVLAVALAARLVLQAESFTDPGASVIPMIATVLTSMTWGHGWIAQAIGLLVFAMPLRGRWGLLAAALMAATPAWMGHAIATERATLVAVLADWVHVAASGAWLGTLAFIVVAAVPVVDAGAAGRLITCFSPLALTAAALVAMSGSVSALLHLSGWRDLISDPYGRLLTLKVAFVGMTALAGAYNWKRSTPALSRGDAAPLRRGSRVEVVLAVVILVVTSVLVASPFPGEG